MNSSDHGPSAWANVLDRRRFLGASLASVGLPTLSIRVLGPRVGAGEQPAAPAPLRARAIVIGINKYDNAKHLKNPVRDACSFAAWLVERAGVQAGDVALLIGPEAGASAGVPVGITPQPATRADIVKTIFDFPCRAGERERLYFFYSGHGMAFQPWSIRPGKLAEQEAIVPSDYGEIEPPPLLVNWILDVLRASSFVEQFFFFDACRSLAKVDGTAGVRPKCSGAVRVPVQYIAFSTAPREEASDREGGAFSPRLIEALTSAKGSSALFDSCRERYLVRWESLTGYLSDSFMRNPVDLGMKDGKVINQTPERDIIRDLGGDSPILAELAPEVVSKVKIAVDVQPPAIRQDTRLTIIRKATGCPPTDEVVVDRVNVPVGEDDLYEIYLLPGNYAMIAEIHGGADRLFKTFLTLVEDQTIPPFDFARPVIALAPEAPLVDPGLHGLVAFPADDGPMAAPAKPLGEGPPSPPKLLGEGPASLVVKSDDLFGQIELLDAGGTAVRWPDGRACTALGELKATNLKAGLYRARLLSQSDGDREKLVQVSPGTHNEIFLGERDVAIPAAFPTDFDRIEMGLVEDGADLPILKQTLERPIKPLSPLTMLVQQLREAEQDRRVAKTIRDGLGMGPFRGPQGLRVLLAASSGRQPAPSDTLNDFRLSLGGLDGGLEAVRVEPSKLEGLGVIAQVLEPGPWRLRIDRESNGETVTLALVVLKDRVTEVTLERQESGRVAISQFAPLRRRGTPADAATLYKLERLEAALQTGPERSAPALVGRLIGAAEFDPLILALAALLTESGVRFETPRSIGGEIVERFPELPDGHVLMGTEAEKAGNLDAARAAYVAALDRGLPILQLFLERLDDGIRRLEIPDHRHLEALRHAAANRIPGMLWSAWRASRG
ncbi:caspase domain-containing protein [Planctomyces sp. SH-PL62]|uniref:caspase family protein n=1 Tax=Planctomyces sp. SH-PL62 TaxID=1636152 RepID=UPI00078EED50|nr:caspase family protein [Planctomyces sp. SH-PL62]AMV37875.1 Caspase domain protein [Planctomyces sp. SH-PL62]